MYQLNPFGVRILGNATVMFNILKFESPINEIVTPEIL